MPDVVVTDKAQPTDSRTLSCESQERFLGRKVRPEETVVTTSQFCQGNGNGEDAQYFVYFLTLAALLPDH